MTNSNNNGYEALIAELAKALETSKPEDPVLFLSWYLKQNKLSMQQKFKQFQIQEVTKTKTENSTNNCNNLHNLTIDKLPSEILFSILEYCSIEDLIQLTKVNSYFHWFINQEENWKRRCRNQKEIEYKMSSYPLWKTKFIEQYTLIQNIHYTFGSTYYVLAEIKNRKENSPLEGFDWIKIIIKDILFESKNQLFPYKCNDEIFVVVRSSYYKNQLQNQFNESDDYVFGFNEISNISQSNLNVLQKEFSTTLIFELNACKFNNQETKVLLSAYYCYEYTKKSVTKQSVRARCDDIFVQKLIELNREIGLKSDSKQCSNCKNKFIDINYYDKKSKQIICPDCKFILPEIESEKYNIEIESSFPKLPPDGLQTIANFVSDFVTKELQKIFFSIEMKLRSKRTVVINSIDLRLFVYDIRFCCKENDDIDPNKSSHLLIYMFPDGLIKSFNIIGDITFECCHRDGRLYTENYQYTGGPAECQNILNLSFRRIYDANVSAQGFSTSRGGEWAYLLKFSCASKSYSVYYIHHAEGVVLLGIINHWIHTQHTLIDYQIAPNRLPI